MQNSILVELKKIVLLAFVFLLFSTAVVIGFIKPVKASGTIYIRADGSIEGTTDISTVDNVTYTFTDNIYDEIVVERDNVIVDGNGYTLQGSGSGYGFKLTNINNVTIQNTNINGFGFGVRLNMSSFNTISANNITEITYYGIWLSNSTNNSIFGNNITNNSMGIFFHGSSNNTISGNTIKNNSGTGIWFSWSPNNTLRNNHATNNTRNFSIYYSSSLSHYIQDIDTSNTIDGKPVYYWINKQDMAVPLDPGYVALVNCTRIIAENLNLENNGQGLLLAFTTNSTITKNNVTKNWHGIEFQGSSNNTIFGNNITNNDDGVWFWHSSNNTIYGNNITNNVWSILIHESTNNKFYHNNFVDTYETVYILYPSYPNSWDDGYPSGGNYWRDYTDVDQYSGPYQNETGSDEIWDHPYVIDENNQDNYPIVPEFPPWTSMLLILIVLTVVINIYKRRLLKTTIH